MSTLRPCQTFSLLGGVALGAGLMYLLDSDRGTGRRARLRDQASLRLRELVAIAGGKVRRLQEAFIAPPRQPHAGAPLSVVSPRPVPDWVLAERARLEIWRAVAHPESVQVTAREGRLTLWGPVRAGEPESLREKLVKLPGLRRLELRSLPGKNLLGWHSGFQFGIFCGFGLLSGQWQLPGTQKSASGWFRQVSSKTMRRSS